jgi:hypothetical protein
MSVVQHDGQRHATILRRHAPTVIEVHALVVRLRPEAARRDVPVRRLITDLISVIADQPSLISAVLDDSGDLHGA